MLILIDADPIVYRCGFASETTNWHIVYEDQFGEVKEIQFSPDEETSAGEQMRTWLAFNEGKVTVLDKSRNVIPDPVSYALRATQVQINSIMEECQAHYKAEGKMFMWISGAGGSYRDKLATVRPYKGNRDPTHKPYHYDAIRDYLRTQYGSYVTSGIEADDAVSIFAHQQLEGGQSLVVCTIDKDLDQIPGEHYNYMNKVFYAITQQESERWFVYQCLAGDITDNVVGVWKCGDKSARALVASAFDDATVSGTDRRLRLPRATRQHGERAGAGGHSNHTNSSPSELRGWGTGDSTAGVAGSAIPGGGTGPGTEETRRVLDSYPDRQPSKSTGPTAAGGDNPTSASAEHMGQSGEGSGNQPPDSGNEQRVHEPVCGPNDAGSGANSPPVTIKAAGNSRVSPYPWWGHVVRAYADSQRKPGCPYAQDNPETIAIEMAQLVKLQEYPGQLWHPHGDLVVPGFGEENFDG